jgi:hypothetical protein
LARLSSGCRAKTLLNATLFRPCARGLRLEIGLISCERKRDRRIAKDFPPKIFAFVVTVSAVASATSVSQLLMSAGLMSDDELHRRQDRLLDRRHKLARFRDPDRSLDTFDFDFNKKMNRALVYELATARSSGSARTCSSSGRRAPAKATSPKPSAARRSYWAIA